MEYTELLTRRADIADALNKIDQGAQWHIDPKSKDTYQPRLANGEHETIWFNDSRAGKGKLHISGGFPWLDGRAPNVTGHFGINVSDTKPADIIAKDITVRLLPDYRAELSNVLAKHQAANLFQTQRIELAKQISRILGKEWTPHRNFDLRDGTPEAEIPFEDRRAPEGKYAGMLYECKAVVNSNTSIKFVIDVRRPELAEQIAAAVKHILDSAEGSNE